MEKSQLTRFHPYTQMDGGMLLCAELLPAASVFTWRLLVCHLVKDAEYPFTLSLPAPLVVIAP